MAIRLISLLFHTLSVGVMAWGFSGLSGLVSNEWIKEERGGHFQFLTIQGLALAALTMVMSLSSDLIPSVTMLFKLKRSLMMIALPVSIAISTVYWSLLFLFPSLILPPVPDAEPSSSTAVPEFSRLPISMDLALHASPALSLGMEFFILEGKFTRGSMNKARTMIAGFAMWYVGWVEYCASYNKKYPYPFLETALPGRAFVYLATSSLALACFEFLNATHS